MKHQTSQFWLLLVAVLAAGTVSAKLDGRQLHGLSADYVTPHLTWASAPAPRSPRVLFIVPRGGVYDKVIANLEEIKARGGPVIAIVEEGDDEAAKLADAVIEIPATPDFLQPIVAAIPLQLLAYHIAVLRGCDVDKPRNLAKSVTVE